MAKRCVIYTRISVAQEASISLARQQEAAEQYAASRGWQVVGVFTDDGVSATHNKPEARAGWQALLDSPDKFDAVIIWKLDRLARRITDFWDAYKQLKARKRSLVSITDNLDMTTSIGRIVAGIIAGFAEMEAEAISDRVAAARTHLVRAGRVVGGTVPYGWRSMPNPKGPGMVLGQDPDRIDYVRGMTERAQRGDTIYSIQQWLDEALAPTPTWRVPLVSKPWTYSTVERILRHPVLAGMTPFNPGTARKLREDEDDDDKKIEAKKAAKVRGADVLRDADGLPVVDESVAILSVAEWRALVKQLDDRDSGHTKPRAARTKTSALLSGLVWCEGCQVRMHRATTEKREGYSCRKCYMLITNFEDIVVDEFLAQKGERVRWTRVEKVLEGGAAMLPEIELRLVELQALEDAAPDRESRTRVQEEKNNLYDLRAAKREEAPAVSLRWDETGWFADEWAKAAAVADQRAVLDDAMERIWVRRGGVGRRSAAAVLDRLTIDWKHPDSLGAVEHVFP